jgi:hypothetical protein
VLIAAAAAYLIAAAVAALIHRDRLGPDGDRPGDTIRGIASGLVDGIRTLLHHGPAARAVAIVGVNRISFGLLTAGGLLLVRITFHPQSDADSALQDFTLLTAAAATGALIGAILTPAATRRWNVVTWSAATMIQAGILGAGCVIVGALTVSFPVLLLGAVSFGLAGQSVKVCSDTTVQRDIPDDYLGRVFTLFDMIVNVCLVAGIVVMAVVSPTNGQAPVLYVLTGVGLLATALWYLRYRPRRVRPST